MTAADLQNLPAHARKGRRHCGSRGRFLETLITTSQNGVRLTKLPASSKRITTPKGSVIIQIPSPVDFFGVVVGTGRGIAIDAKETQNIYRLATSTDHLSENQRQQLLIYGEAGAVAGLLCHCVPTRELYWCDWKLLTTRMPSIAWASMAPIGTSAMAVNWGRVLAAATGGLP